MNDKKELELLHEIASKIDVTGLLVALLRLRLEEKLAKLRDEQSKDWMKRSSYEQDRLRGQITLLASLLFDFELFGEHPDRTWVDFDDNTLKIVSPEERIQLHRKQREAYQQKLKAQQE